jgi:polyisoprenoid-binding protein YceI
MSTDVNVEAIDVPGQVVGMWKIDTAHPHVGFLIENMMPGKVYGHFNEFGGTIVTADNPLGSEIEADLGVSV